MNNKELVNTIRSRRTSKVLGDSMNPQPVGGSFADTLHRIVEMAGWAPFHYAAHKQHRDSSSLSSIVPWRCYVLDTKDCRALLKWIHENEIESGKIGRMLAVANGLILVTWLPDPGEKNQFFDPEMRNMEHLAASGAAIQNMLLYATSCGIKNYWSSGGVLRSEETFNLLKIPLDQILLGAVFFFDKVPVSAEEVPGKLKDLRGDVSSWSISIDLG